MSESVESTSPDLSAHVEGAAGLLGLPVAPDWREAVVANLRVLQAAAALVGAFPLPDEADAAPVYEA